MPSVTGVVPAKRRAGWMEIQLDGALLVLLPEEDVWRLGLEAGRHIEAAELEAVHGTAERAEALRIALRYLEARPRARREVEVRLRRDGFSESSIQRTIDRLFDLAYLDDKRFAAAFSRDRIRLRPCGERRLRADLRAKGVSPGDADVGIREAMAEEGATEADLLDRVATARAARLMRVDPAVARRRLYAYLERRGFASSGVRAWLDANWSDGRRND